MLKQQAYSILELLISMFIGVVIFGISTQVLISMSKQNRLAQNKMHLIENANTASFFLTKDIKQTGFFGGVKSPEKFSGSAEIVNFNESCSNKNQAFAQTLFPPVWGINNIQSNIDCLENIINGSDVVVLRYLKPETEVSRQSSKRNKYYARVGIGQAKLFKAKNEKYYKNEISPSQFGPTALYSLQTFIYYLRDTGRRCDSYPIYGLYREFLNNKGKMQAEEIVSGVEQMQLQYLYDGIFQEASSIPKDKWSEVKGLDIRLLFKSNCVDNLAEGKSFRLFDALVTTEKPSKFLRYQINLQVSLRN